MKKTNNNNGKTKICSVCGRELPLSMFNRSSSYQSGYRNRCKDCDHLNYKANEWQKRNMALDRGPWPFDDDCHEMDMQAIAEYKQEKRLSR